MPRALPRSSSARLTSFSATSGAESWRRSRKGRFRARRSGGRGRGGESALLGAVPRAGSGGRWGRVWRSVLGRGGSRLCSVGASLSLSGDGRGSPWGRCREVASTARSPPPSRRFPAVGSSQLREAAPIGTARSVFRAPCRPAADLFLSGDCGVCAKGRAFEQGRSSP